jgi:hypothetical protein
VSLLLGVSGCICDVGWLADDLLSGTEGARRANHSIAKTQPSGSACCRYQAIDEGWYLVFHFRYFHFLNLFGYACVVVYVGGPGM